MAEQPLLHIRVQMRFKLWPVALLAADNQFFPDTFFLFVLEPSGYCFEVMHGFVGDAALRMPSVIAREPITAAPARQGMKKAIPFLKFVEAQIKQPSSLAIYECDAKPRLRSQQRGQGLQVETPVHE